MILLKKYSKSINKKSRLNSTKKFLIRCRKYALIPKFVKNSTTNISRLLGNNSKYTYTLQKLITQFQQKILNIIITHQCALSRDADNAVYNLQEEILNTLPIHVADEFLLNQKTLSDELQNKNDTTHRKKFDELYNNIYKSLNLQTDDKAFVNLSTVSIPNDIRWLLSLGPKFALPSDNFDFPLFDVIADTEEIIKTISDSKSKDIARAKIASIVSSAEYTQCKQRKNIVNMTINRIYNNTVIFFKKHNELLVASTDKGKSTVVMLKTDYDNKIQQLLNDHDTYITLQCNPIKTLQAKNNKLIHQLLILKLIENRDRFSLLTHNSTNPKMYALMKTHKPDIPARPVVACVDTPTSAMSSMLSDILKQLLDDDIYNIKNSITLKQKLSNVTIESTEIMVSFDIVSLFTNIPVNLAIEIINEQWEKLSKITKFPKSLFFEMLKFCLIDGNYFVYKDVAYRQIFGMPMGNPLSTIIADIVTQRLLNTILAKLMYVPKVFVKYVDDIFAIIPKNAISETQNLLNSFHSRLKFTVEVENDSMIPYLDVKIIRNPDGTISTDWYQKCISSNRILNYYSQHPHSQKLNTASNFVSRVLSLSSEKFHKKNKLLITTILTENNYPYADTQRYIHSYYRKRNNIGENNDDITEKQYKGVTYIKGVSEKIEKVIKHYCPQTQTAYRSSNCIKNIFTKLKDKVPSNEQKNVIYRIPCQGNIENGSTCELAYIGQTKQYIGKRIDNHKYDLSKKIHNTNVASTALMDHCKETGHTPNFDNVSILDRAQHYGRRLTKEALHIQTEKSMNHKRDSDKISSIYCSVINNIQQNNKRQRTKSPHNRNTHTRKKRKINEIDASLII